jgi:hypothetical protein
VGEALPEAAGAVGAFERELADERYPRALIRSPSRLRIAGSRTSAVSSVVTTTSVTPTPMLIMMSSGMMLRAAAQRLARAAGVAALRQLHVHSHPHERL